jgi:hypothetical protein
VFRCNCTSIPFHRQHIALALAAVKQIELEEQRQWLTQATQCIAAVALQIDEGLRRLALQEEIEKNEKWWAELAVKEQKQNEEILAAYQKQPDGGKFEAMLERGNKAKADMDRGNARLERLALLKKGVLRGRRKEFAVMPTDGIGFRG